MLYGMIPFATITVVYRPIVAPAAPGVEEFRLLQHQHETRGFHAQGAQTKILLYMNIKRSFPV